ncbi:hypothetical protein [Litoribacter ruber]|uniref:hypothetical protein n=1 Tax=Litoribacter ruber TaxID=702568 RepID=UPI001BD50F26|nr:hypothetical protein [Litoribacter alkaliphilus]
MRQVFFTILFLIFPCLIFAQEEVPADFLEKLHQEKSESPPSSMNFFFSMGLESLFSLQQFSERLESNGLTPFPDRNFVNGLGFNIQKEKWTVFQVDFGFANSNDIGDVEGLKENVFYSNARIGGAYNVLPGTHLFRFEPGLGLLFANGRYTVKSTDELGSFDGFLGQRNFNELRLSQSSVGLNVNVLISPNHFHPEPTRGVFDFFSLEIGSNLLLHQFGMQPNLADHPDLNLTSVYFKARINVISQ